VRPIDRHELLARVRTQIRRKRRTDHLRDSLDERVELAVKDALTGLFNRRYLESHVGTLVERARRSAAPLSVLMADIDAFKSVNDTLGHSAGDSVLREFAQRLRRSIRSVDLACRLGGEEFIVVMPDTSWNGRDRLASACVRALPPSRSAAARLAGSRSRQVSASPPWSPATRAWMTW
jgi:two-component system cell cycle response regulator